MVHYPSLSGLADCSSRGECVMVVTLKLRLGSLPAKVSRSAPALSGRWRAISDVHQFGPIAAAKFGVVMPCFVRGGDRVL